MNEVTLTIRADGMVQVVSDTGGVKAHKLITPDQLLALLANNVQRGKVSSCLLPRHCLSYTEYDDGERHICLAHPDQYADISYYGTEYKHFPLPRLVFGFRVLREGRIAGCELGVTADVDFLKPTSPMYAYPFSNVSGFRLCTGNNALPNCVSLHTLASLPYLILAMPNNDDHFKPRNNRLNMAMRSLLEHLKDKPPEYYYSDILIPTGQTLSDFLAES